MDNSLHQEINQASDTTEVVYALFCRYFRLTPSDVHRIGTDFGTQWSLDDVARAIDVLSRRNVIEKQPGNVRGSHGIREPEWSLVPEKRLEQLRRR